MMIMSDKRDLVFFFYFDMFLLVVLDLFSEEFYELKSLEWRLMYLMDDIFFVVKKDFGVGILCYLFCKVKIVIIVSNNE